MGHPLRSVESHFQVILSVRVDPKVSGDGSQMAGTVGKGRVAQGSRVVRWGGCYQNPTILHEDLFDPPIGRSPKNNALAWSW